VLRANALDDLPPTLDRLPRLEVLDLSQNQLRQLPALARSRLGLRVETQGNPLLG
jgi:Leucine-rich repeat (LRR) protein